jgi:hypothetical protein
MELTATLPVLVTRIEYVIAAPAVLTVVGAAVFSTVRAGARVAVTVAVAAGEVAVVAYVVAAVAVAVLAMLPFSMSAWVVV